AARAVELELLDHRAEWQGRIDPRVQAARQVEMAVQGAVRLGRVQWKEVVPAEHDVSKPRVQRRRGFLPDRSVDVDLWPSRTRRLCDTACESDTECSDAGSGSESSQDCATRQCGLVFVVHPLPPIRVPARSIAAENNPVRDGRRRMLSAGRQRIRARAISYVASAAAADTFSDESRPRIGILTM